MSLKLTRLPLDSGDTYRPQTVSVFTSAKPKHHLHSLFTRSEGAGIAQSRALRPHGEW